VLLDFLLPLALHKNLAGQPLRLREHPRLTSKQVQASF